MAKLAPLAAERDELGVATVAAMQVQEAVGPDAVFQEGVELSLDEWRQVSAGSVFGLRYEGCSVLLHPSFQRGLFRAVLVVVDRGAIRSPLGLLAADLHARLLKW